MALAAMMAASFSAGVSAQGSLPQAHTQGSLRYSCGGIGLDESTAMRAAMKEHPSRCCSPQPVAPMRPTCASP